ncbi:MAG: aminopeptidase P family protein [Rhizobiales bacterium]|nr:aminopeptidase P family protein [Hyphomicrobiales bacterium]OJY43319.1 MAG: X-Pro aminopeptidase [Rhizobiales bacterium 64-17]
MFEARFQTFDDVSDRTQIAPRVAALRAELQRRGVDGFIVPRADRQQNEYVAPADERLAWLTGFTGSAGAAIVLPDRAALFVDGRYQVQAPEQTDTKVFEIAHLIEQPPSQWLRAHLHPGAKLGYDPWLHTSEAVDVLGKACEAAGATLVPLDSNPIDSVWNGRPAEPSGAVHLHDPRYAGEAAGDKLTRLREKLTELRIDTLVISDPHNVAWIFNIRGSDVAHTPLPLAFALVPARGRPALYVAAGKLDNRTRAALEDLADVREPAAFLADLDALKGRAVQLDRGTGADALTRRLEAAEAHVTRAADPVTAMKAVKNDTEIAGSRSAHQRDGAALVRFLAWFDREAPRGALTEIDAVAALESFRRDTGVLKDVSFPTISGAGPNGAIVHYRVTSATNRKIGLNELFLIDSGAQYEDGTTDVTRTIAVGTPSAEMRDRFTRVLRGHIAIATAVFPRGTTGAQLDTLARLPLWQAGLDFDHGTGHGVGSYLSVHEGPARISKLGTVPLERGIILSNEPGYYKTGAYGIRIENLVLVVAGPQPAGAEKTLDAFETLTLAPIDRRLIDPSMLSAAERDWIDRYHARVRDTLSPLVDAETRAWLTIATEPLGRT